MHYQQVDTLRYTIKSSILLLLTFATAFFPRVITTIGFPSVVNFVHFGFITALCVLTLPRTPIKIWNRISIKIWFGLFILLVFIIVSGIFNSAGIINVILDFVLLSEPFVLLVAMISIPMTEASIKQFRFWMMLFAFIHLFFIYFQYFILRLHTIGGPDTIKGVFLRQGAGHHVGGAVALTAAIYFFVTFKISIWLRILVAIAFAADIAFSDSKQVVVVFLVSLIILLLTKLKNFREALRYFVILIIAEGFVFWTAQQVFSKAFKYWGNIERFSKGLEAKFSVFSIINSYHYSPFNSLLGLGPGHTIGRLGWLIPDYIKYLQPLGVTSSEVTQAIFAENDTNPFTNERTGSSMFSLTFSWAGIWGDLGFLGLGAYLYIWFLVWSQLCLDNLSKFLLITVLVFGGVFSWLEEPGYMLFIAILIGLQWQEHQIKKKM
jgi:hypothetical protein